MDKCNHDFRYFTCGLYRCSKCRMMANEHYVKGYNRGYEIGQKIAGLIKKEKVRHDGRGTDS